MDAVVCMMPGRMEVSFSSTLPFTCIPAPSCADQTSSNHSLDLVQKVGLASQRTTLPAFQRLSPFRGLLAHDHTESCIAIQRRRPRGKSA